MPERHRTRTRWPHLLLCGCLAACSALPGVVRITGADGAGRASGAAIALHLDVGGALGTAAVAAKTAADIHHITVKLYTWTGTALGALQATHATAQAAVRDVTFSHVPTGVYKITAEAFSSSDDSVSITKTPVPASANTATVTAGSSVTTYAAPDTDRLVVTIGLTDGVGDQVNLQVTPVNGSYTGRMAPDDTGDVTQHHDYTVARNGYTNYFVWIPRFRAVQLLVPANCGTTSRFAVADNARPVGWWIDPTNGGYPAGVSGSDWAELTFGGFYAGKYEASWNGPVGIVVVPHAQPMDGRRLVDMAAYCNAFDPHAHLMYDSEWAALAVWSQIKGVQVQGSNKSNGTTHWDEDHPGTTFTVFNGTTSWSLTGSGTNPAWTGDTNLTTHTGTTAGVYDLNGNLREYTTGLTYDGHALLPYWWRLSGVFGEGTIPRLTPAPQPTTMAYVASLDTAAILRQFGVPRTFSASAPGPFDGDGAIFNATASGMNPLRGGGATWGSYAGVWSYSTNFSTGAFVTDAGCRPCLRY
jgi:hypothetical protein